MTPTVERTPIEANSDLRVIGLVSAAHLVSHYYIIILPPLFTVIRADFSVSYTELGFALAAFNIVSALLQTPAGFLVDRIGARPVLIGGLLIGAAALAGAAVLPSFWAFVAMFALLGLGNTVYHPADYSLLSKRVSASRIGQAYSVHTFAGMVGGAVAPVTLLVLANSYGWRGAYLASAGFGFAAAALVTVFGTTLSEPARSATIKATADSTSPQPAGWSLLLSAPVLLNLVFFVLLALANAGVQNYGVVALDALRGTPLAVANAGLTAYLVMSAAGVLLGGVLVTRVGHHAAVASAGLVASAAAVIGVIAFGGDVVMIVLLGIAGLTTGLIMPSRDMLVRAVTPPGAFGKVFGFVTTGFNIGGMIAPIVFGWLMDTGRPAWIFVATAVFSLAAIPTVMLSAPRQRA